MKIYDDCVENSGNYSGSGGQLQYSSLSGVIGRHDRSLTILADYFKEAIDNFRYCNRALTDENVIELLGLTDNIIGTINPTSCNSEDGSILFGGLVFDNSYKVTYVYNLILETLTIPSNTSETYSMTELVNGLYSSITLTNKRLVVFMIWEK